MNVLAKDCTRKIFRRMRLEYSISNIVLTGDLVKEGTLGEVVVDALTN